MHPPTILANSIFVMVLYYILHQTHNKHLFPTIDQTELLWLELLKNKNHVQIEVDRDTPCHNYCLSLKKEKEKGKESSTNWDFQ